MFAQLAAWALRHRAAVLLLSVLWLGAGARAFLDLPIEAFPDPTDTQVTVITLFPGQPSEEVERQVALPLERSLAGTPGLARMRTLSLFGLCFSTLTFEDGVEALPARAQVLERLRSAELPPGVQPELGPLATPIGEIYRYTLTGADPMALRTAQDWTVRPLLLRVSGVADVVSYGGLVREVQVEVKPTRLAALGVTLADVERALRSASSNASGGVLERGAEQLVVRSLGLARSLDDLANTRIATHEGVPVRVRDVADVREGWTPRQGVVSRGQDFDTVEGIVLMRRGQNPSHVLANLKAALDGQIPKALPQGVVLKPFYDRTELVDKTLQTVSHNLLEGASLVVLVLFVFLLDLRAAILVALVIPFALLSAFFYLRMRGMSANLLSMGAIDFGVVVDGSVVIVEAILLRLSDHSPEHDVPIAERIRRAVAEVIEPTMYSLLIIIAAYLPIFLLERVEGRIFAPMSNTVVAALAGALLASVTVVPVLATFLWRKPVKHRVSPLLRLAERLYDPTLRHVLQRPRTVLAMALVAVTVALAAIPRLGSEFLPELNEGALYATFTLPANTSLQEGRTMVPRLTKLLTALPPVQEVISQLGRPEDGTDATLTSNLEFFVKLKPPAEWPANMRELSQVIEAAGRAVAEVPGIEVNFSQPIRDNVNENISGQFGQIAVKLFGEDLRVLQAQAEKTKQALSGVAGIADLGIVKSGEMPQFDIVLDRARLAESDLDLGEVQALVAAALGGAQIGEFWQGETRSAVVLRLAAAARNDPEKIRKLGIPAPGGATIPLEQLAEIKVGTGRASISRENGKRVIGLRMNVRGRDLGTFVRDAQQVVAKEAPLPPGVRMEWGGEFENKERALARLAAVAPLALLITLALLVQAFRGRMGPALVTLGNVPMALIGGVVALSWMGMPLSVAAAVGFIALIGQAALNGVLLLSAVEAERDQGRSVHAALWYGCRDRLRPVLMTAALAALGLVPAMTSRAMGSESQRPIAAVVVGGTVSACLLTLLVLPALYLVGARWMQRGRLSPASEPAPDPIDPGPTVANAS